MNNKKIVVDGLLVNYQTSGNGKKSVLMLHGWGDNSNTFSRLIPKLIGDFTFYVMDLPGFGATDSPKDVWGLDNYAEFVEKFINKLGLKSPLVIGHSNGGAIAIRGISNRNIYPSKLVLLASSGIRGEYKGRNKALRLITKTGKIATAPLPRSIKNKLRRKVYDSVGSDMLIAEHLQETFKKIVTDDVRQDAGKLQIETLLIYGDQDKATPIEFGKILTKNIPNSRLEIINDAGHFVHHDAEEKVANLIMEFAK